MKSKFSWHRAAQLGLVLVCALGLKQYYSTASVNQLRWILAPTTFVVELVTGSQFEFESHAGYMSSDRSFVIAASCAGVNFLITAFLMLSLRKLWRDQENSWPFIPAFALLAYLATVVANTVRISTAIRLQQTRIEFGGLDGNQLHRLEGIVIYFGFLMLLYLVSERLGQGNKTGTADAAFDEGTGATTRNSLDKTSDHGPAATDPHLPGFSLLRPAFFPLLVYYATTLGIPLATAFFRTGPTSDALWEHFAFVMSAPLILMVPLATFHFAIAFSRRRKNPFG
jgi:exosortase K